MKLKRILAMALVVAALCGLAVTVPASAAAPAASGFTDITDPATAEAAELLRLLGVVDGTGGGAYSPNGNLTRAQFCKMAIEIRGEGSSAQAQMNRTVFLDVKGSHWARGYVNYASSLIIGEDGERLIVGVGDGNFRPDRAITYAEAVTMAMRLLGYSAANTGGGAWPDSYINTARAIGLVDGITVAAVGDTLTRAQAAILFQNLLYTNSYGAQSPYLTTLGCTVTDEAVLLSLDATATDGTAGCVLLAGASDPYKTDHVAFDAALTGQRVRLMLDRDRKVLAIQPNETGSSRTVTVAEAEVNYLTAAGGERLTISPDTIVYDAAAQRTYAAVYLNLRAGTQLTLCYGVTGALEYAFLPQTDASAAAMVAKTLTSGNPFAALVGSDTGYRILKNGVTATLADIRQYDVATYDKATKTLSVSDLRLTGIYEDASPSPRTPLTVTVMGAPFPVLASATADLASFKLGDTVTLLLTADGQVAGAVSASAARSTTVGIVTACTTTSATVQPLMDLNDAGGSAVTFTGTVSYSSYAAERMQGALVTVSSSRIGQLTLTRLSGSAASATLNVNERTLGATPLADNVYLYERVGSGAPVAIKWSQITRATVPASSISYVGRDYAGRVNILVLDDVTGDRYSYGFATVEQVVTDSFGGDSVSNTAVSVGGESLVTGAAIRENAAVGIAASLETVGGYRRLASWVELTAVANVSRAAFDITRTPSGEDDAAPIGTVTTAEQVIPIAGNVACYNATTGAWFDSLDAARAYSDTLTIYYDRPVDQGGKVRLVVAR